MLSRFCQLSLALVLIAGCGTMAVPVKSPVDQPTDRPQLGRWTLAYTGGCSAREAETIQVTHLDDAALVFDDFELRSDDEGQFTGSADFVAPMPVDGRDVVYTISYALRADLEGKFSGIEKVTEGGGHSLDCPVELLYQGS